MDQSSDKKGQSCSVGGCPFCSMEGMILGGIGIAVAFLAPSNLAYIGFLIFLSVYFLPLIKKILPKKNNTNYSEGN